MGEHHDHRTEPVRVEIDMSPTLLRMLRHIDRTLTELRSTMVTKDELTAQITTLRDASSQMTADLAELVKDQDRVLQRLADLIASNDLSGAADLVAEVQASNKTQAEKIAAADAALEAADPETTTTPQPEPTEPGSATFGGSSTGGF